MHILFLSYWLPFPADNGSQQRIANLLRGLARRHHVTLIAMTDDLLAEHDPELDRLCAAVHLFPQRVYRPGSPRALAGLFSLKPRSLVDTYDPAVVRLIGELRARRFLDVAIVSQLGMSTYASALTGLPTILEELEVGLLHSRKLAAPPGLRRWRQQLPWLKLKLYLRRLLPHMQAVTVVSEQERALLAALVPGITRVALLPNGVDTERLRPNPVAPRHPERLIFAGSLRYHANHDAMVWFVERVLPLVQARRPAVNLLITGDHGGLPLPPNPAVRLTGHVPDVAAVVQSAAVSIAPLREGGGTRLKILEAMALGTPVVATSLGAEGLTVRSGEHLLVADSAESQATAILELLNNPAHAMHLAAQARRMVETNYNWQTAIWPGLLKLVESVAGHTATKATHMDEVI